MYTIIIYGCETWRKDHLDDPIKNDGSQTS